MSVRAILNPRAGVAGRRALAALEAERAIDLEVRVTVRPGEATQLAREAAEGGARMVIAAGGDGTVNEVARGLFGTGTALGIVPAGSGNGLARALGIPLRPDRALEALAAGARRRMDVGRANGSLFLNVAGIGFDAAVSQAFHRTGQDGGRRGLFGYLRTTLGEIRSFRSPRVSIEAGDQRLDIQAFIVTFANGPQFGSAAVINPGARLDDGRLELVVFDDGPLLDTIAAASRMFLGGLERLPRYRRVRLERAVLTADSPLGLHRDGDPDLPASRIEVDVVPRGLEVIVPRATANDPNGPFAG